jgi:uncharacterized protein YndB with AHSA1/START domain
MVVYEASARIRASRPNVWNVLADVESWPAWLPTVRSVEGQSGAELREGARFVVSQPRLPQAVWRVAKVEPARAFIWESRAPGTRIVAEHVLASRLDGSTELLLRLSFHGLIGKLIGRLTRATSQRYLDMEASALQTAVEGRAA